MSELTNSVDFLEKVLCFNEKTERQLVSLLCANDGCIGGDVAKAWIDWDKGIKCGPLFNEETIMEIWIPPPNPKTDDIAKELAKMGFYPVREVENLYRSRKKMRQEIYVNYVAPPDGTTIVFPIAGSGYEYAHDVVGSPGWTE